MIEVKDLSKKYGEKHAVNSVDFTVNAGEMFAYLGPNGSGKSTTIKMLTGLLEPSSGQIKIFDQTYSLNDIALKKRMSFVGDTPDVMGKLTGSDYLNFIASIYEMEENRYKEKRQELTEMFNLEDALNQLVEEYSHGMRQKLVLTAALMHEPELLFLDEPTVGLDPKSNRLLKDYLRAHVNKGNTVFLTTHTLSLAEEIADRICIIYQGEIKALGTLEELRSGSAHSLEEIFLELTDGEDVYEQTTLEN